MNLLERVLTLLRANLNSVVEKAEDPEKVLRQLQLDMRNQLVQVKTQVATAIAESHKLQKRSQERKILADTWLKKAEQAVQQGNDTNARAALTQYNDINRLIQRYQQQQKEQDQLVSTMRGALHQLEAKIAEVDTTIDILVTRKRNALIQQRVFEALNKNGSLKDKESANRAQSAILDAEARAQALADLHRRDLSSQIEQLSTEQHIEQQLQDLKSRQLSHTTEPLLPPGPAPASTMSSTIPPRQALDNAVRKPRSPRSQSASAQSEPSTLKDIDLQHLKNLLDSPQKMDS